MFLSGMVISARPSRNALLNYFRDQFSQAMWEKVEIACLPFYVIGEFKFFLSIICKIYV